MQPITMLIPYMCDHVYILKAAFEHFGTPCEVLPPTDDESARLGVDLVLGKECTPCAYVAGDMIRRLRLGDLDPARTWFLLTNAAGPCRYGQYHVLFRHILDEQGFSGVKIVYPTANNSYQDLGEHGVGLRNLLWKSIAAVDLLQVLLHQTRPYARTPDEVDQVYRRGLDQIIAATQAGGGQLIKVMAEIGAEFRKLGVDRSTPRPRICLVGEIYVRHHSPSNRDLIRRVEELGGEVVLANIMEFIYYVNWWCIVQAKRDRNWREVVTVTLMDYYQRWIEYRMTGPLRDLLEHRFEPRTATLMQHTARYMDPTISTEAVLTVGKAVEMAHHGASGILNVLPFTCMPGIISAGLAPRVRQDLDNIPWLDLSYDMQQSTNIQTRLEAFMYQARHFQLCHPPQVTVTPQVNAIRRAS